MATYTRLMAALALALFAVPATVAPALAASTTQATLIRLANFDQDGPSAGIDIYVDGARQLSQVAYKSVSHYLKMAPGSHRFDVRGAGASGTSSAVATLTSSFTAGAYSTVAAAGRWSQLAVVSFADGFASPGPGKAQVRAIHLAPEVPAVDIWAVGVPAPLFSGLAFPVATSYLTVPAATYDLQLWPAGSAPSSGSQPALTVNGVTVKAGAIESLIGTGGVNGPIEVVQELDAATAPASGGVGTGEGGPAMRAYAALLLVLIGLMTVAASRWVGSRPSSATANPV